MTNRNGTTSPQATGREIAAHFNEHYHDAFAAAAQPIGEVAA